MSHIADLTFDNFYLALAAAGAVVLVLQLLRALGAALFGLQHLDFTRLKSPSSTQIAEDGSLSRVLLIDYSWKQMGDLRDALDDPKVFDVSRNRKSLCDDKWVVPKDKKNWIVLGLESILMNQELRIRCLDFLEELTSDDGVKVYFFSEVSPLARLRQAREREKEAPAGQSGGADTSSQAHRESFRWSSLFADFTTFYGVPPDLPQSEPWTEPKDFVDKILNREFRLIGSTKLYDQRPAAREKDRDLRLVSHEAVIAYLANFLGDYYQRQWLKSTKEERMAMHHLAHGRYINAANFIVLDNLLLRGLVRRDPDFQLMNESFAHWIRMLNQPEWFEEFRIQAERGGTWQMMRGPLLLTIISSVTFLTYLDRGGSGSLLALLPAVAAGVPLLLSQISQARNNLPS
jgi:hypothetical protein